VLKNRPYRIWKTDGQVVKGVTDLNGTTKLLWAEGEEVAQMQILKRLE